MRSGSAFRTAVLVLLFVVLALGIHRLFALRFESGDVYPPYSSLRTDPLGCRALYDAFDLLPEVRTGRHYLDLEDVAAADGVAVLILGVTPGQLIYTISHEGKKIVSLAENGSRIIIALRSDSNPSYPERDDTDGGKQEEGEEDRSAPPGDREPGDRNWPLPEHPGNEDPDWGIEVGFFGDTEGLERPLRATLMIPAEDLPETIPVYSGLHFMSEDERWQAVYEANGKPVILERAFGSGNVVLLSDSYLLSNEALRFEFFPDLLTWVMAGSVRAVFDEAHLGVFEDPGIMSLVRKYRLGGFLVALVSLVLLWAWKRSVPLVQRRDPTTESCHPLATEKDQFSGLVNLLRRNIGSDAILETCLNEWSRSFGRKRTISGRDMEEIRTVISREIADRKKKDDPVEAYNRITALLAERKGR